MADEKLTNRLFEVCARANEDGNAINPNFAIDDAFNIAVKVIAEGANVNARCSTRKLRRNKVYCTSPLEFKDDLTPLLVACYCGNVRMAELLLDSGASDDRALFAAAAKGSLDKRWAKLYPSQFPSFRDNKVELIKLLIGRGFDVNFKIVSGCRPRYRASPWETVLCAAVESGCEDTVKVLIASGAQVDYCSPLLHVCSPVLVLHCQPADMARLLLQSGADAEGCSLFEMAVQRGMTKLVEVLFDHQKQFLPDYDGEVEF